MEMMELMELMELMKMMEKMKLMELMESYNNLSPYSTIVYHHMLHDLRNDWLKIITLNQRTSISYGLANLIAFSSDHILKEEM